MYILRVIANDKNYERYIATYPRAIRDAGREWSKPATEFVSVQDTRSGELKYKMYKESRLRKCEGR